jgi:hypothetical protein
MPGHARTRTRIGAFIAAAVIAVVVPIAATPASAAQDTSWKPAAGSVPTSATYAYIVSSSGDYIGGGRTYSYTPDTTDISVSVSGGAIDLRIEGEQGWTANFVPPDSVTSVVKGGVYTGLTRYPFNDDSTGGLDFSGEGRGCNNLFGWYAIDDAVYSGGELTKFLLRFEQRCESASASPLRGQIKYDATAPLPGPPTPTLPIPALWAPAPGAVPATGNSFYMASQSGDWVGKGATHLYTNDGSFDVSGGGSILGVNIREGSDWWYLDMAASNRADAITAGYYSALQRYPFQNPVRGGFSMSGNGAGCNQLTAWVAVDEVDFRGGDVNDITFRYEQHCDGSSPALRGRVHWEPPPASGAPGVPTSVTATPAKKGATVSWGAPTSAGASAVSGYEVYAYEQGNVTGPPVTLPSSARTTTFSNLTVGVPYTFKVRALNATGGSWRSAGVTAVPADPAPKVTALTPASGIRTGGTAIQIGGVSLSGATSVKVGGTSVPFTAVSDSRIDIVSPDLPAGTHQVIVTTSDGTSPSGTGSTWTATKVRPSAPTNVGGTPRKGGIDATWGAPSAPGDDPIASYTVSATKAGSLSAQVTLTAGAGATTIPITGLVPGASYTVKVVANSAAGSSPGATSSPIVVPPVETGPFADVTALVKRQYLDFAGRAATSSETANDTAPITAGTVAPEAYIAAMRNRPEWAAYRAPIIRLYSAYFDRLPDTGGLTYWAGKLRSGTSLSKVSASFAASNEFKRKYGSLSNRNFVLLIYTNVLKRTPDTGGVNYWTGKLDKGMSRGAVMTNFSESSENVRKTTDAVDVVLVYTGMLRRVPTGPELAAELAVLDAETPITDLVGRILDSQAYANRF